MRFQPMLNGVGIVALCTVAIGYAARTPRPLGNDAPPNVFSAERALAHVRMLSRASRVTGSTGHEEAFIYIMSRIAALGLEPYIQATTGVGTRYPVAGRVRNIVARIPGTRPANGATAVLLVAHWDGVGAGPAAGDDASGVAVVLETLRAIRNGPLLPWDVIALFTDSEEAGLLGAAAFAREHAWARDVGVILNFEARGTSGPSLMFETGAANYDMVRALRTAPGVRATSLSTAVYRRLPNDTDLSELLVLDKAAMNFAFIGGVERYHTAEDDVEHLSAGSVQHHGNQALHLARFLASSRMPARSARGDAVFFDLPLVGLVVYPESWAVPLAALTLAVAIAGMVFTARRRGSDYGVAAVAVLTMLLSLVIAMAAAAAVAALIAWIHSVVPWGGTPLWRGIYAAALALLSIGVVAAAMALGVGRRLGRGNVRALDAGALVGLAGIAAFVTVQMPGVSFLFTWPVFAASVSAFAVHAAPARIGWTVRWVATALILVMLVPTIYLMVVVALGLDVSGAAVLALLSAIVGWLLAPHLRDMSPRPWRVPLVAVVSALVCILIGIFTVRTNEQRPAGSAFVYASDSAIGGAWLAGGATNAWGRAWLERVLPAHADSARAIDPPAWLTRGFAARRIVPAARVPFPVPSVSIVQDSSATETRVVTLRVRAPGARSVQVSMERGNVVSARVDEREIRADRYRQRPQPWRLEYVAPSDSGFTLTLALRGEATPVVSLIARHAGIPPGVSVPPRPAGLIPIGSGDASYAYRRFELRR